VKTRLLIGRSCACTLAVAVLAASLPSSAATQVEISASAGYTFAEGVSLDRALLESIDKVGPASGPAFVASVNFWTNGQTQMSNVRSIEISPSPSKLPKSVVRAKSR